ncbi:P-loop NTPase, partial [Actinomyces bovis]|uniref:P-loop NTPase n=1 Tax=Actinomyces bovis TaxID=1658 RepID=UPI000DD0D354
MSIPTQEAVHEALSRVIDPEIRRPITDLNMVKSVEVSEDGTVTVHVLLTVAGCPLKDTIRADVEREVSSLDGVTAVQVELGAMNDEDRAELRRRLRGGAAEPVIPFTKPGNLTRVYAVTSGKGGVGKSSVTANLAAAMAAQGLNVGVVDADIYGFSIPRMLGVEHVPTQLDGMIVPPIAHGVKVISIGMFVEDKQPVVWRGPMLHRAVQQFLSDVFWGDLDVLLLDLPPGTGDVTISVAQLLPNAEILVITTPQTAAAEVAERTGLIATQTQQRVVGVIENMSWMEQPDGSRLEVFGAGGGQAVSESLTRTLGYEVPLLAQLPLDIRLREGADAGVPASIGAEGAPTEGSTA